MPLDILYIDNRGKLVDPDLIFTKNAIDGRPLSEILITGPDPEDAPDPNARCHLNIECGPFTLSLFAEPAAMHAMADRFRDAANAATAARREAILQEDRR